MKMTVDGEKDIIGYVKGEILAGNIGEYAYLNFYVTRDGHLKDLCVYGDGAVDGLPAFLFDLSMTNRIASVSPYIKNAGPPTSRIDGFDFVVEESKDGQTNITPKLIDFFKLLATPWGLEKLKEPFSMNYRKMPEITFGYGSGQFIMMPPPTIWEWLEGEEDDGE